MEGKQTVMCETIVKRKRMCFQPGFESISRACHPNVQIIPEELSLVGKGSIIKGVLEIKEWSSNQHEGNVKDMTEYMQKLEIFLVTNPWSVKQKFQWKIIKKKNTQKIVEI